LQNNLGFERPKTLKNSLNFWCPENI